MHIVRCGKAAADVENFYLRIAAGMSLLEYRRRKFQRRHVVRKIRALAADVKAEPFDREACIERRLDQVNRFTP